VRTVIGQDMVNRLYDCQVIDRGGEKIGSVKRVWLDGRTGDPTWASVHTGLFGLKETFVPLQRAELQDGQLLVPVAKDQVKGAPHVEAKGDQMSESELAALYRHYGFAAPGAAGSTGRRYAGDPGQRRPPGSPGQRSTAGDDDAMTRSEERLKVGTEDVETGRVRLVKHVVTEEQQVSVPVSHEEVRVEREPITEDNRDRALQGPEISAAEHEVSVHAQRPVVEKETVPVERVRLNKDTVTEQQTVSGEVRKEQIEVEDESGQLSQKRAGRRSPRNQR
jgi:uncharacterized protein (TIGR02271 family)